jgi:hypothetical protein
VKHLLPASAILALLFATPAPAATDDSTLAARLLRELELLRTQQQSGVQSHYAKTMSDLNAGAVSGVTAVDIFEESIKATDFEGK